MESGKDQILALQILRGAAALAVAFAHVPGLYETFPASKFGAVGVDVFFVISGFIMVYSSRRLFGRPEGAATFLRRRLIRIVPLYWAVSISVAGIYLSTVGAPKVTPQWIVSSLTFIPFGDGAHAPITGVGWTLNCEMFFYVCFAVVVALPMRPAVAAISALFIGLSIAWGIFPLPAPLEFWFHPIILEFVLGTWLGLAYASGWRLPSLMCVGLVVAGALLFAVAFRTGYYAGRGAELPPRFLVWGLPALLIVAGTALPRTPLGGNALTAPLAAIGDISYALYLVHPMMQAYVSSWLWPAATTFAVRLSDPKTAADMPAVHDVAVWLTVIPCLLASTLLAFVIYFVFERSVSAVLRRPHWPGQIQSNL